MRDVARAARPASTVRDPMAKKKTGTTQRSGSKTKRSTKASAGSRSGRSTKASPSRSRRSSAPSVSGKHLVIVESPTKAKTINRYLGPDYVVMASVGHVRDLPPRAPKGVKQEVPGVDIDNDFEPTYEVLANKKSTVSDLKRAAKQADDVWFATDLDREGEAIAWHLAEALGVPVETAKRVMFNAITKSEIEQAFNRPRNIDTNKVNAQQARRILDRIVGYQVSPFLWKKVAGGLSAGRVQSVSVRVVVEREREIEQFLPEEYWRITGCFATDQGDAPALAEQWRLWLKSSEDGKDRSIREQIAWLSERSCVRADLVEVGGQPFKCDNREQNDRIGNSGEDDFREDAAGFLHNAEQGAIAQKTETFAQARNGRCACQLEGNAAGDQHHAERCHERGDPHFGNDEAVDETASGAGHHADRHGGTDRHACLDAQSGDGSRKGKYGADAQVDAAGNDDHRHPDAQQADDGRLQQHSQAVVDGEKGRVSEGEREDQQGKGQERR